MAGVLKISEAAAMGLHAGLYLAGNRGRAVTTREMAETLKVSEHHLAKVMGRLVKEGLVNSERGPSGGFRLGRDADEITLLEVYEAIDGSIRGEGCLLDEAVCEAEHCLLGDLIGRLNTEVRQYLAQAKLSQFGDLFHGRDQAEAAQCVRVAPRR
jgi:Rrf2 family protein